MDDFPETVGNVMSSQLTQNDFFRGVGIRTTKQILYTMTYIMIMILIIPH